MEQVITNALLDQRWISPTALVVLILVGPFVAAWLSGRRKLLLSAFAVSLIPVAVLTLYPVKRVLYQRCEVAWALPTIDRVEIAANVVLFVVPALLATVAWRRPLLALLGGVATSAGIEAFQGTVTLLGRSCSTNDWMANSIGTAIGAGLGVIALITVRRRRTHSAVAPPSR